MKPRVAIFFTGGTISMRIDPKTGRPVPALSGEEILARIEGLKQLAEFEVINFALLPGPHITPPRMLELSRRVGRERHGHRRHARHGHARRDGLPPRPRASV